VKKRLQVSAPAQNYYLVTNVSMNLDASYTYDNEGRMTATQYPSSWNGASWSAGPNLGNTFDSMGRLQKLTDLGASSDIISNATYNPAGQLLTMTGGVASGVTESRTYNSIGQLTNLTSCPSWYGCAQTLNVQYNYPATQNNGKITSQYDALSGETVTYAYDSLNRLASASGYGWGQNYGYDGFGNLTNQTVTSGTAPALSTTYDPATNRQTGECADANGNINSATNCTNGNYFDVENRLVRSAGSPTAWAYSYAPGNKRVWRGVWSSGTQTVDEVTFWSTSGQKLETYQLSQYQPWPGDNHTLPQLVATATGTNYYFGGKLVKNTGGYVTPDRLGSIGKYFPYGQERPSATTDGKEKFATYFRDSETGLDYAQNRYHQPGMGRFMTPDRKSGHPSDPGTWNKYSYTAGDPVNRVDRRGNDFCAIDSLSENGVPLSDQCNGNTGDCVEASDPSSCLAELIAIDEQNATIAMACGGTVDTFDIWDGTGPPPGVNCGIQAQPVGYAAPPPDCASAFTPQLTNASHYDVLARVLNENSYGLGASNLLQEDLYIVSVLQNRATTPGAGNLNNGQDSRSIDNQAKYAGNPSSTSYSYPNLSNLIQAKANLPLDSAGCQSFLNDISTAQKAIQQVLTTGSVDTSVFFWYTKGYGPLPSYVGKLIMTINNNSFYGLPNN